MKHQLNPDFIPTFPPRYIVPMDGVPVIGTKRDLYLSLQVTMSFFGAPDLTVQVHSPTQRGAYTAALVYARRRHTLKRCTELTIAFLDFEHVAELKVSREAEGQTQSNRSSSAGALIPEGHTRNAGSSPAVFTTSTPDLIPTVALTPA